MKKLIKFERFIKKLTPFKIIFSRVNEESGLSGSVYVYIICT